MKMFTCLSITQISNKIKRYFFYAFIMLSRKKTKTKKEGIRRYVGYTTWFSSLRHGHLHANSHNSIVPLTKLLTILNLVKFYRIYHSDVTVLCDTQSLNIHYKER